MNLRNKKGSISIFVLVALLFMSAFLIIAFAGNVNRSKTAKEQFNIISQTYAYGGGDKGAYDKAYTDLRNKNKQTMTAYSENSSNLELTKTFEENMSNYRIYGNSVQDTTNGNPSPTNPVEIQSVGDKTKNLLDINNRITNTSYTLPTTFVDFSKPFIMPDYAPSGYCLGRFKDVTITEGNITWTSIAAWYGVGFSFKPEKGVTYKISYINNLNNSLYVATTYYSNGYYTRSSSGPILLQDEETDVIVSFRGESVDTFSISNLQIEEGNTATEYEPYGKYKIPVQVTGKNLFNINDLSSSDIATKVNEDTIEITTYGSQRSFANIKVVPNTQYTISFDIKGKDGASNSSGLALCVSDGKDRIYAESEYRLGILVAFKSDYEHRTITFTSKSDYISLISLSTNIKNLQLEMGTTETDYERYKGVVTTNIYLDEPLRKTGDYADYIDFKTGIVVRQTKFIQFIGSESENWRANDNNLTNTYRVYIALDGVVSSGKVPILSNKFETLLSGTSSTDTENMQVSSSNLFVRVLKSRLSELNSSAFKTWVSSNNFEVVYPLAEEDRTETINLSELKTFEDYTNIQVLTEVVPYKIEVEYQGYTLD